MTIKELLGKSGWKVFNEPIDDQKEIKGVYCGDLLSWVMGNGQPGQAWITVQGHINTIAVATLREFSCIIYADNTPINDDTIEKAKEENVIIIASPLPVYETAKVIMELDK